ncbi:MAG: hypothetical protein LBH63_03605, partial [Clostridiales Family XIII bacterium]|nr:hypothetical protein [Clostridiales Family XIII bacterium]
MKNRSSNQNCVIKRRRAAVALALALTLTVFSVAACKTQDATQEIETADPIEEEAYDFSVFLGNASDPVEVSELISRYTLETGIVVKPLITEENSDDERALWRALESNDPPAAFLLSANANAQSISDGGFFTDLSTVEPSIAGVRIPFFF